MTDAHTAESTNLLKYHTRNPLMRRIIGRFLETVLDLTEASRPRRIVDLGCGEGIVARELGRRLPGVDYVGIDLSPGAIEMARTINPEFEFRVGNVLDEPPEPGWADMALCLEVVEHLDSPGAAMGQILKWTSKQALISVPWEPWFRMGNLMRGRHVSRLGNHPEHVQQFNRTSLEELILPYGGAVKVSTCFPWLIAQVSQP